MIIAYSTLVLCQIIINVIRIFVKYFCFDDYVLIQKQMFVFFNQNTLESLKQKYFINILITYVLNVKLRIINFS